MERLRIRRGGDHAGLEALMCGLETGVGQPSLKIEVGPSALPQHLGGDAQLRPLFGDR